METQGNNGGHRRIAAMLVPLAVLSALIGAVAQNEGLRALVVDAVRRIDPWAVAATLPVQLLAILLCTAAQRALLSGVTFRASFASRLVRDAGHNLLIILPGLGEAIGARVLVLLGGRARAALSLRALDIAAEVIAELPYMGLAGWVLWRFFEHGGRVPGIHIALPKVKWPALGLSGGAGSGGMGWAILAGLALLAALGWLVWGQGAAGLRRRLRIEARLFGREMVRQRGGMPLAIFLHFIAWGLSGVQVFIAARIFGLHLGFVDALAIESAATSARIILFFVPGGLVMQEAGAVLAGAALGVPADAALALSLVLRLRDVVFGAALLLWPWLEHREGARRAPRMRVA